MISRNIIIKKINIKLNKAFSKLDGIQILHISDLHLTGRNKRIENYINKLKKIKSDFIMVTGDLIDSDNGIEWSIKYLKGLSATYGTWVCLGNHDKFDLNFLHLVAFNLAGAPKRNNIKLLKRMLLENDIQILINKRKTLEINSTPLTIIGTDIPCKIDKLKEINSCDIEQSYIKGLFSGVKQNEYVILLNHIPKNLGKINAKLVLSGHTHGGQIRLPFIGPLIIFSPFQHKYNRGLYNLNGYYLNISAGLGISRTTPIRLFCPPEATLLTLKY